ncbi:MAG: flavodoxin family protein [Thermoproteota archaeon]
MKVLAVSCSPRENGNTVKLLNTVLKGAKEEGAEVELYSFAQKNIMPCDGCMSCFETGECHIEDDFKALYDKLVEADGIVIGTPIYAHGMSAQAKIFIDRTCCLNRPPKTLTNKVGGVVVVAGSLGIIDALKSLYFYFVTRHIVPANFVAAYPTQRTALESMDKCMEAAFNLGRQIVKICRRVPIYPEDIPRSFMAFGTHTL